jgi:hypothetical protein
MSEIVCRELQLVFALVIVILSFVAMKYIKDFLNTLVDRLSGSAPISPARQKHG